MSRRPRGPEPWDAMPQVAPRHSFERSARFWLNAYPRRWRELHGDEATGVLEEVALGGAEGLPRRLPRAEIVGLLKAGWALRWREHPPFWRWLAYRVLARRLPAAYWWWAADDIRSPWYPVVEGVGRFAAIVVGWLGWFLVPSLRGYGIYALDPWWCVVYAALFASMAFLARNSWRRRAWLKHVVDGNVPASVRPSGGEPGLA
ncbi:hypothetical protein [Xylanimonas protaetiae]|uniref:Uncharacterized protein n=1 Tax=Xylanimonas protaetiae TaxID=2509457 RepID=A0A4P6F4F5_9MICO|nr:hypothetical protein [Xylanimonas protaetiae]QAY70522.1 hypothetical protein ET471_11190 [Xylanimonas protaetiae]